MDAEITREQIEELCKRLERIIAGRPETFDNDLPANPDGQEAAALIRRLVADRDEARKALATDARIDAIFAAILTTRDNPEDGTRDHLPRPLRNYLSEACGSAGLTGFNDGYAEAQGKFESRVTAAEAEVGRLRAENEALNDGSQTAVIVTNWFDLAKELGVPKGGSLFETVIELRDRACAALEGKSDGK